MIEKSFHMWKHQCGHVPLTHSSAPKNSSYLFVGAKRRYWHALIEESVFDCHNPCRVLGYECFDTVIESAAISLTVAARQMKLDVGRTRYVLFSLV